MGLKQKVRRNFSRHARTFVLLTLSILLASSGPMASYSYAQSADNAKLQELKEKALSEIERRLEKYQKTFDSLKTDVSIDENTGTASFEANGKTADGSVKKCTESSESSEPGKISFSGSNEGLSFDVLLPCGLQDKVKGFLEKIIEQLKSLADKVKSEDSLSGMDSLADNIDSQFGLGQLTEVQAAVTQAIESVTGVLASLKSTHEDLQSQVTHIKDCVASLKDESGTVDSNVNVSEGGVDASVTGTGGCDGINFTSEDIANDAQGQLDQATNMMSTIQSTVTTVITMLTSLFSSFSSLTGGLGSLGDLGNLGNLGNMTSGSGLESLTGSSGEVSNMLGSFSNIMSQIELIASLASSLFSTLSSMANNPAISSLLEGAGLGDATEFLDTAASTSSGVSEVAGGINGLVGNLGGYGGVGGLNSGSSSTSGSTANSSGVKRLGKANDWTGARGGAAFRQLKRGTTCTVDYSRASGMSASGSKLLQLCDSNINKIESLLSVTLYQHPVQLQYIPNIFTEDPNLQKDYCKTTAYAYAYPRQGRVYACTDNFKKWPNNEIVAIHEVAHLTQAYAMGDGVKAAPQWVTEGIAQYAMYKSGLEISFLPSMSCKQPGYQTYLEGNGYGCAAAMLVYIERVYNPKVVKELHNGSNTKGYTNSLVTKGTGGKTINQLYKECLKAECKGGKSL